MERDLAQYSAWLARMPVQELVKRETLPEEPAYKRFGIQPNAELPFGVASIDAWDDAYA